MTIGSHFVRTCISVSICKFIGRYHCEKVNPSVTKKQCRADSRFVHSQCETALLCNRVSHWLGTSLNSALQWVVDFLTTSLIIFLPKLIPNMRGPSYLGLTRSILWLLMPWLLASPGHQQPWYWLCKISKSWSYTRKDFNYLNMSVWKNDIKCKYMFMIPLKKHVKS